MTAALIIAGITAWTVVATAGGFLLARIMGGDKRPPAPYIDGLDTLRRAYDEGEG